MCFYFLQLKKKGQLLITLKVKELLKDENFENYYENLLLRDWIDCIRLLLFAVRESEQESLGLSPFELVFGHTVRGPHSVAQREVTVKYE